MDVFVLAIISFSISFTKIACTAIKEYGRWKRIERLEGLEDSKIDSIGNYEKRSNFWNQFSKEK